jgi:hypothetical protein
MAITILCRDTRFVGKSLEVSRQMDWARAKYSKEQADPWNNNTKNEIPLTLETRAKHCGWRFLGAWMDMSE